MEVDGVNVETVVHEAMEAGCDNGTGHVEDSHGEGAGGTVDGRTQKERRIQRSYDTQVMF